MLQESPIKEINQIGAKHVIIRTDEVVDKKFGLKLRAGFEKESKLVKADALKCNQALLDSDCCQKQTSQSFEKACSSKELFTFPPGSTDQWLHVRHLPIGSTSWHPAKDDLKGSDKYGDDPSDNS